MLIRSESSNAISQGMLERGDQAAHIIIRLQFPEGIKNLFGCNQAIKVNFCLSKILILVANGSTGTM